MNQDEEKQSLEMQQLVSEFPMEDQLEIVNIYYNLSEKDIATARVILSECYSNEFFG